jgi:transposase
MEGMSMRPPVHVQVRGRRLTQLLRMYVETTCPRTQLRIQMVLLSHDRYSVEAIAKITHKSDDTVRYWLHRFKQDGCAGLIEAPHSGRPSQITPGIETFLHECIPQSPRIFKLNRPGWTTALLAKLVKRRCQVRVTDECIRQHLKRVDAVCRRPTWTVKHLAEQQPGYAQKKGRFHAC